MKAICYVLLLLCGVFMNANVIENATKSNDKKKEKEKKIEIKGDSLVIEDSSCISNKSHSLLAKLKQDSKESKWSEPKDCDEDLTDSRDSK